MTTQHQTWSLQIAFTAEFPPAEVAPYLETTLFGHCRKVSSDWRKSSDWRNAAYEFRGRWVTLGTRFEAFDGAIDVLLRISPRRDGRCRVRIRESGFADERGRDEALAWLRARLRRLHKVFADAVRLRKETRQAIIVVHGIGEQRPTQTLRSFTDGVLPATGRRRPFFRPDYTSSLFELRTMRIPRDKDLGMPPTDVYELYWAHLIRDTTLGQVYGWLLRLIVAPRANIPVPLRKHFLGMRVVIGGTIVAGVAWLVYSRTRHPVHPVGSGTLTQNGAWWAVALTGVLAVLPTIGWAVLRLFQKSFLSRFLLDSIGDAARYLEPRPDNVARRRDIRAAGVELLDKLHDSGQYSRIIVFGHSLGSVIAYDILSYSWIQRSRKKVRKTIMTSRELIRLEDLLNPRGNPTPPPSEKNIQALQYAAWMEYRRNGFEWLVSDFVTAGSPLTNAGLLLNLDKRTKFQDLVADRIYPTCPPQTETWEVVKDDWSRNQFTFTHGYKDPKPGTKTRQRSVLVPHFAGLFGLIRWTNLYFPMQGVIGGDPIGGRLQPTFGSWIRDVELANPGGGFFKFAHSYYWQHRGDWAHIHRLKEALALPFYRSLDDLIPHVLKPKDLWWVTRRTRFAGGSPPGMRSGRPPGLSPE